MSLELNKGDVLYFCPDLDKRLDRTVVARREGNKAYTLKLKIEWVVDKWVAKTAKGKTVEIKKETHQLKRLYLKQKREARGIIETLNQ